MREADEDAYTIKQQDQSFVIQDDSGRTIVTARDRGSAETYAVLLNEAYRKGYKDGYRQGKAAT